jgi:hypothetical protein
VLKSTQGFKGCFILKSVKSGSSCLLCCRSDRDTKTAKYLKQSHNATLASWQHMNIHELTPLHGQGEVGVRMSGYDTNYGAFGELIREGQKGDFNSHIT